MKPTISRSEAWTALDEARATLDSAIQAERAASLNHTEARNHLERARKSYEKARETLLGHLPEAAKVTGL